MSELVGIPKKKESTTIYIVSFPIDQIHNGEVHVHKEKFEHANSAELMARLGAFITDLEAKDEEGKLMIYPLNERKFLNLQEKIARINNQEAKEEGQTQS